MKFALLAFFWLLAFSCHSQVSELKRDEEIVFFPALASPSADGKSWDLEIRGSVFEPEKRRVALAALRRALGLKGVKMSPAEEALFKERARLFMVDHERGRRVVVRVGEKTVVMEASAPDGQFFGVASLSAEEVQSLRKGPAVLRAVLASEDTRSFTGNILFADATGLTVVSDIDDTIKVTDVSNRKTMLRQTFLKPYEPVRGMPEVYRAWARQTNVLFCYVSASPWQLFEPLSAFMRSNAFPAGMWYLKKFRWKDESVLSVFQSPEKYKPAVIQPLLERFPQRQFVLVGDSGERDPEIYGVLARQYPRQVVGIFIRNVTGEPTDAARYQAAFHDVPPRVWQVFERPEEITDAVANMGSTARKFGRE